MRTATLLATVLKLESFLSTHPEVADKVETYFGTAMDISQKLHTLADRLRQEKTEQITSSDTAKDGRLRLNSLEKTLANDADYLESLIEVYSKRSAATATLPRFTKRGDFLANLREFIASLAAWEDRLQIWDTVKVVDELKSNFTAYEQLLGEQSSKENDSKDQSDDVASLLAEEQDEVLFLRRVLKGAVEVWFPEFLDEIVLYQRENNKIDSTDIPTAPTGQNLPKLLTVSLGEIGKNVTTAVTLSFDQAIQLLNWDSSSVENGSLMAVNILTGVGTVACESVHDKEAVLRVTATADAEFSFNFKFQAENGGIGTGEVYFTVNN